jgi:hypothetical protein
MDIFILEKSTDSYKMDTFKSLTDSLNSGEYSTLTDIKNRLSKATGSWREYYHCKHVLRGIKHGKFSSEESYSSGDDEEYGFDDCDGIESREEEFMDEYTVDNIVFDYYDNNGGRFYREEVPMSKDS